MSVTGPKHVLDKFEDAGFPCIAEPYRALEVVAALAKIEEGFKKGLPSTDDMPDAPTLEPGSTMRWKQRQFLPRRVSPAPRKSS